MPSLCSPCDNLHPTFPNPKKEEESKKKKKKKVGSMWLWTYLAIRCLNQAFF